MFTFPIAYFGEAVFRSLHLTAGSSQCAYISDGSQTNLEPTSGDFTIEGWVKFDSEPSDNDYFALFSKWVGSGDSGNGQYYFRFYKDVGIWTTYYLQGGVYTTTTRTFQETGFSYAQMFTTGVWYHLAVVFEMGGPITMTCYVDGFVRNGGFSASDSNPVASGSYTVGLGAITGTTPASHAYKFFDGKMSNWRFWNTARTAQQIKDNMFEKLTSGTNLDLSLLLNNNLDDETSNANDFTGLNSPTYVEDIPEIVPACIVLAGDGTDALSKSTSNSAVKPASAMTGEMWIKITDLPIGDSTSIGLFGRAEQPTFKGYEAYLEKISGTWYLSFKYSYGDNSGGGIVTESVAWTPSANTWYHLAFTCEVSTNIDTKFYVGGSQQGSTQSQSYDTSAWFTHYDAAWTFFVGRRVGLAKALPGKIDDFRFWSTARSQTDINNNKSTEIDSATNLGISLHLNQRLWDYSGNNLHLGEDGTGATWDTADVPF